jgi:cytochrome c-type biogenesis protein CcmH/NrfG
MINMSDPEKKTGYIKTENMLMIICITLTIGFVGGVFFSVYKSGSAMIPGTNNAPTGEMGGANHTAKIAALKQLIAENQTDVESWVQLGHLYFDTNQFEEAINAYKNALKHKGNDPNILTDLGVMYRRAGNPKAAIEKFNQATAIDPKHQIARFNKGIVLMHDLNDMAAAAAVWQELVEINPNAKTPDGQLVKDLISQLNRAESSK